MFVTCKQSSYKVTFFNLQKVSFFQFYPTDLVNTKTTIPHRVGEQRWIYTSPSGDSPCNTKSQHYGLLLLWTLHLYLMVSKSSAQKELVMVFYASVFSQSESGKYFEWIISNYWMRLSKISWFVSGEQINYFPKPKAEANNWSARNNWSAIWRIFAELDKPKRTLSKMNLTSMQVSMF